MTDKTRKIAVLTGDIVSSTALGPEKLERAFDALRDCAEMQAEWMGENLHFTRHRGDGWQVALAEPKYALRSALAFRAALRAEGAEFDSYIGIAEGDVRGPLEANLNNQTDAVFIESGHALDMASIIEPADFEFPTDKQRNAILCLADHISKTWTSAQAAVMLGMLSPRTETTYTEIANALGRTRQAVTKSLEAAGYKAIERALSESESDESHV